MTETRTLTQLLNETFKQGKEEALEIIGKRIKKKEQELTECVLNEDAWKMIYSQKLELESLYAEIKAKK